MNNFCDCVGCWQRTNSRNYFMTTKSGNTTIGIKGGSVIRNAWFPLDIGFGFWSATRLWLLLGAEFELTSVASGRGQRIRSLGTHNWIRPDETAELTYLIGQSDGTHEWLLKIG